MATNETTENTVDTANTTDPTNTTDETTDNTTTESNGLVDKISTPIGQWVTSLALVLAAMGGIYFYISTQTEVA